jgi:molybdate transport system substrate-binding protein
VKRIVVSLSAFWVVAAVSLGLWGCATPASTQPVSPAQAAPVTELKVSAGLMLKKPFEQLAPAFEKANNTKIVYNFGTMGVLQKQVEGGAPGDVFASASAKPVNALVAAGLASAADTETFAQNELVVIVPKGNPAAINAPSDLSKAQRIVTGDPVTTPHGATALQWLDQAGLASALKPKLVYADTLDLVARGEVDAAIAFASSAKTNPQVEIVYTVPPSELKPIPFVATTLTVSKQAELGRKFIEYLMSTEGQQVLAQNGFMPAP